MHVLWGIRPLSKELSCKKLAGPVPVTSSPGHTIQAIKTEEPKIIRKNQKNVKTEKHKKIFITNAPVMPIKIQETTVSALIDSGASGNFIANNSVTELKLSRNPKEHNKKVTFANGQSTEITHDVEIPVTFSDTEASIRFDIIEGLTQPIILGLPFLQEFNPQIDWTIQNITENKEPPEVKLPQEYNEFQHVFSSQNADKLPEHRTYDCAIDLIDPKILPPFKPLYNLSAPELAALDEYVKENLAKGFIRPSKSPAGAPIFFVKKKDGSLRPCVDYRELNSLTVKNRYPLPLITELLDRLGNSRIFTKIDLKGAYNLIRIREGDEYKTAFRTRQGLFEYLVMPFGLTNAPAVFQMMINDIFRDVIDVYVIAYLDDILIFSPDPVTHTQHVKTVLQRLSDNKLYAKLSKCIFSANSVEFLGFVISDTGIHMAKDKVKCIEEWKQPTNRTQLQSFLGFTNFYRRFINNYSKIARPLTNLTKKNTPFEWNQEATQAFNVLKTSIASEPTLAHPDPSEPFILETDASDFAIGAVLLQRSKADMELHPVAFYSRKMIPAEINYTVHDKELLAIVAAFKHWRHYLVGSPHTIEVFSDHKNLSYFSSMHILKQRHARWNEMLSEFDFILCYRPGKSNIPADALSRQESFEKPTEHESFNLKFEKLNEIADNEITEERKLEILRTRHDSLSAGHPGIRKTYHLVAKDFNWPGLRKYVEKYVKSCDVCQRSKSARHKPYGLLNPLPVPHAPWTDVTMDFIVKLPPSKGFDSILVVVCRRTKMAHFIPCQEKINASQTADLFMKNVYKLHGLPERMVTDRGPQFTSKFWTAIFKLLKVDTILSSAYHPQTDGQSERVNQCLEQFLRCYSNYAQDDWIDLLHFAEFTYNNSFHTAIKTTPFFANYGFNVKSDTLVPGSVDTNIPALNNHLEILVKLEKHLSENLQHAQDDAKRYADLKRLPHGFRVNDQVMLLTKNLRKSRPSEKLDAMKIGPFTIMEKINDVSFRLDLPDSMKIHPVFHVSLLEPYVANTIPNRIMKPPPPVTVDDVEEFIVSEILDSRFHRGQLQYLVSWEGYGASDNSWEPAVNVKNAADLVFLFHQNYPSKPSLTTRASRLKRGDDVRNQS